MSRPHSALSLLETARSLSTGCPHLDACFGGAGLVCGHVYEVFGEASTGKSQLCMQLAARTALPTYAGGAQGVCLYLSTEDKVPTRRLLQIAEAAAAAALAASSSSAGATTAADPAVLACRAAAAADEALARIKIGDVPDTQALSKTLSRLPALIRSSGARLVILDSIAAPFRGEATGAGVTVAQSVGRAGGFRSARDRSDALLLVAAQLRRLAARAAVPIVVTNQAADYVTDAGSSSGVASSMSLLLPPSPSAAVAVSGGRQLRPALGSVWDACVNTRIALTRTRGANGSLIEAATGSGGGRALVVVSSPFLPRCTAKLALGAAGLTALEPPRPVADAEPTTAPLAPGEEAGDDWDGVCGGLTGSTLVAAALAAGGAAAGAGAGAAPA